MSFVNLHAHSHYSLLDGFGSPMAMVKRSKDLGYPAVALTDHGVVYGLIELYKAAKAEGIKPILGCEFYIANRTRFDKEARVDVKPYHLTVFAKNNKGYQNLLTLVSKAHLEGFYYKPRIDYDLLKEYGEGLIVLSGCLAAHIPRTILTGNEDEINKLVEKYIDLFGKENFYLEIQDNCLLENLGIVNAKLKLLAKKYDLNLVATNDSHYPCPGDSDVHDIMLCIQTGTNVNDENRMHYTGDYSIRELSDMKAAFADCPEAIENTVKIAEACNVDLDFGKNLIPSFETPNGEEAETYLRKLCEDGLKIRFPDGDMPKKYNERLDFELKTVHDMGFDTYFLIVHDFVKYAKEQKIVVGPGRGSAAGSIISWSLNITNVDPIHYGLFFERFLNPERISMPDIDIDFADNRRDEVLNYVVEKYGREYVAQIITFGTMAPRAAVRDVGRALGYPYQEVDILAKTIPPPVLGKYDPLIESIKEDPELKKEYQSNPRSKTLLDYAKRMEGSVRHVGTHACAVVISDKPLTNYTALQFATNSDKEIVTQYSAKPLEDLGLLKMDFLGLRNLTVIETTCKILRRTQKITVNIDELSFDDEKTFELFQRGDTTGVFQFESPGIKRYLRELKPTIFDDVVAMGALYRPGPMEWIPNYISGKHSPKKVRYLHKSFKSILENTYGVAVYQEQILQLARDFAGFSLGQADLLRKAVGKKIPSLLAEQREKFVAGAVENGHKEKFASEVFEKVVEPFAGYGFNKAHAVCYGVIAYHTAYLKAHYPIEFMTALLCSDATNTDRVVLEIKECTEMGIDILSPSVNESFTNFTVVDDNKIRFGLLAIKGVGEGPITTVIEERDANGPYKSIEDFAKRVPSKVVNKKLVQALAYTGAFDEFGDRNQIAESYEEISKYSKSTQEIAANGQTDIFGIMTDEESKHFDLKLKPVPLAGNLQKLKWEKDYLGMYVSGHPLRGLGRYISRRGQLIGKLQKKHIGKTIKIVGLVSEVKKILTRTGAYMSVYVIEDSSAKIRAVMFPKVFTQYGNSIAEDAIVCFSGKLDFRRDQYQISCNNAKILSIRTMIENAQEAGLYDVDDKSGFGIRFIDDILDDEEALEEATAAESTPTLPYTIEIPGGVPPDIMTSLKNLLVQNKGNTSIELFLESSKKKIKLPFGVNLTDELKSKITKLLV